VRETFVSAISKSSQDCRLRILLSIEAADNDEVKTLHWERLCVRIDADGDWHLLARNQRVPFSLYIPTIIDRRFPLIGRRDLRALVLVASPSNIGKFQLAALMLRLPYLESRKLLVIFPTKFWQMMLQVRSVRQPYKNCLSN